MVRGDNHEAWPVQRAGIREGCLEEATPQLNQVGKVCMNKAGQGKSMPSSRDHRGRAQTANRQGWLSGKDRKVK